MRKSRQRIGLPASQVNTCAPEEHKQTHKDECGAQVFVVFLDELSVVFFCFTAVRVVEPGAVTFLG